MSGGNSLFCVTKYTLQCLPKPFVCTVFSIDVVQREDLRYNSIKVSTELTP